MEYEISTTDVFSRWLSRLKDRQAVRAIALRLTRAEIGNLGDVKSVGDGVSEMRIFVGKGYRLYFTIRNGKLILLLNGGNKTTQRRDIEQAKRLLSELEI
ncbi:MAG: type II toxin-antitoxin system RelE/ParE family toxin [Pseudomonadota bacterium]